MLSNLEREFARWFESLYSGHDRNIEQSDSWMEKKNDEIAKLQQKAITFEKKMEEHAQLIERLMKEKAPKDSKFLIYDSEID